MSLYVTHQLSDGDAEAFEKHYFGCERCWNEVQAATEIRAALAGSAAAQEPLTQPAAKVIRGPWTNWRLLAAAAGICVALAGGLLLQRSNSEGSLAGLAAAAGTQSPIAVRLTGPLSRMSPPPVERGGASLESVASPRLELEASRAIVLAEGSRTASRLHAAGVASLLMGRAERAVDFLTRADASKPNDSRIQSDLVAAYVARGLATGNDEDFRKAFDISERVPGANLPETKFNRALAEERRQTATPTQIENAWEEYLRVDATSPWAAVARQRRDAARARRSGERRPAADLPAILGRSDPRVISSAVRANPEETRRYVEEELLPLWGRSYADGAMTEAAGALRQAQTLSSALKAFNGESLAADSVDVIQKRLRDRHNALLLAQGHASFGEGRVHFGARRIQAALKSFRTAQGALNEGSSPFEAASRMEIAACAFNLNDYQETSRLTVTLDRELINRPGHVALLARVRWLRGLLVTFSGEIDQSLHYYGQALSAFEQLGEKKKAAFLHALIAEMLGHLGETQKAWRHRDAAFSSFGDEEMSEFHHQSLGEAARAAMQEDKPRLAIAYLETSLHLARNSGNAIWECDANRWLAMAESQAGRTELATTDLYRADLAAERIVDLSIRARSQADIDLAGARICRFAKPAEAERRATTALAFFERMGSGVPMARCLVDRGRIYRDRGELALAERDFRAACQELERQRTQAPGEELRISFFDNSQTIFDEFISLLWTQRRTDEAFLYSERARARALLDDFARAGTESSSGSAATPVDSQSIAAALGPDVTLVEYRTLPDRLLIWTVSRGRMEATQSDSTRKEIEDLVDAFELSVHAAAGSRSGSAARDRLSEVLIQPVESAMRGAKTVVFVPDRELNRIPFAALRMPGRDRYLVEDMGVAVVPSATLFLAATERSRLSSERLTSVLLVGDPVTSVQHRLPSLAFARQEVTRLAEAFPDSAVLLGSKATPLTFLAKAPQYGIIHVASHTLVDFSHPQFSSLVLSPDPGEESGLLRGRAIAATTFPRTRLVFLAACSSASGPTSSSEGSLGIGRAFLSAGVPSVIATLWPIDDSAAAQFSERFYLALRSRSSPLAALRTAQLSTITRFDGRLPAWAAFEFIGAVLDR